MESNANFNMVPLKHQHSTFSTYEDQSFCLLHSSHSINDNLWTTKCLTKPRFIQTCWHEDKAVIAKQGSVDSLQLILPECLETEDCVKNTHHVVAVRMISLLEQRTGAVVVVAAHERHFLWSCCCCTSSTRQTKDSTYSLQYSPPPVSVLVSWFRDCNQHQLSTC